jgi:Family of unknown function (DUF6491)
VSKTILLTMLTLFLTPLGCGFDTTRTEIVGDYEVVATEVGEGDCFMIPGIVWWFPIDDHQIFLQGIEDNPNYLVTTKSMCRGMLYAPVVEIANNTGRVCQNGSRIAYRWTPPRSTCGIENIEIVADKDAAVELAKSRTRVEKFSSFELFFGGGQGIDESEIENESEEVLD